MGILKDSKSFKWHIYRSLIPKGLTLKMNTIKLEDILYSKGLNTLDLMLTDTG